MSTEYPENVIDEESYDKFMILKDQIEQHPDRYYQASDEKTCIDLTASKTVIANKTGHLPAEELKIINSIAKEIRVLIYETTKLQAKAFGHKKGNIKYLGLVSHRENEILDYFGAYYTTREVRKIIFEEWGYDIHVASIRKYYNKNRDKIEELQKKYVNNFDNVRLSHKKSRLEELYWIYNLVKDKFLKKKRNEDARLMQSLIESIKKEIEGDIVINASLNIDIDVTVKMQIQQEMMKGFNITALVISKLAGRYNVDPLYITSRLANSQYAKFTGFGDGTGDRHNDEITLPSNFVYDFDKIKRENKQKVEEIEELKIIEEIPEKEAVKAQSIKEDMMKMLEAKQGGMIKKKQEIRKNKDDKADRDEE